jgi:hypothetical protein
LFYRSPANTLIHRWRVDPYEWSPEIDLGGQLGGDPTAAWLYPGSIKVLYRNGAGRLCERQFLQGTWYPENDLNETILGNPTSSSWRGRVDVFYSRPAPEHLFLFHRWYD